MSDIILDVKDLHTYIFTRWGVVKAVDGVSFTVREGETLGIVGESGSGKTITSLSLLRLIPKPAARIVKGEIWLDGENLLEKNDKEMRHVRGRKIAMILQDPQTSLNPVFTIGNQLIEAIRIHYREASRALLQRAEQALRMVRVAAPAERLHNYPHQMSGGMKQRVVGAIGISCAPKVLIATEALYTNPLHPYTKALFSAALPAHPDVHREEIVLPGEVPSPINPPSGCRFHPRCPFVKPECSQVEPVLKDISSKHRVACHLYA